MHDPEPQSSTSERRSTERVFESRPMSLTIEATVVEGRSRDLTPSSVFFLADSEMRMKVSFEDADGRTRHGHLVRYQRMPSGGSGWAIEFDD